jgi:hypothetical protein
MPFFRRAKWVWVPGLIAIAGWANTSAGQLPSSEGFRSGRAPFISALVRPAPARRTQVLPGELKRLNAASRVDCMPFSIGASQEQDLGPARLAAAQPPIVCTDDSSPCAAAVSSRPAGDSRLTADSS